MTFTSSASTRNWSRARAPIRRDRQANELLPRSVVLVAPTSHSARPASFRPEIDLLGETTRVLVEQVGAVDAGRIGDLVGRVSPEQQWGIDEALMTVLGLQ